MSNVIIGIGGTGGKVIRALRNRISQSRGTDDNHYLCLDTMGYGYFLQEIYGDKAHAQNVGGGADLSAAMSQVELNQVIQELVGNSKMAIAQDEYLQLKGLSPALLGQLLDDPYAQNGTYNWLRAKDFKRAFNVSDRVFEFTEGAGQYRQIGRIASFATAAEIQRRLSAIEQRSRPKDGGSRSVYIMCSLAGGTGAGNFMDLGVLARSVFSSGRQRAKQGDNSASSDSINLLLLMNGAFGVNDLAAGGNADMEVIAHAVLRELGRFQVAPLPKSNWVFSYPEIGNISIEDQSIFDQVCLFDFVAENSVGESYRQDTVYPGMAEMVDLLTSPGTGAKVNVSLVNLNKQIRMAQARSDDHDLDKDKVEAWKEDQFSPFFSTFNSFRIIFPRLAYQKKAKAQAVQHFVEQLLGQSMGELSNQHIRDAFAVSNWPATKGLFDSLFGNASDTDFEPSSSIDPTKGETSASLYLDQNESQLNKFLASPFKETVNVLGGDLAAYCRTHIPDYNTEWQGMPEATRDINMREDLKKEVDGLRLNQLSRRNLKELGLSAPQLGDDSGISKAVKRALLDKLSQASANVDEMLANMLRDPSAVSKALWTLRCISDIYLKEMSTQLLVRLDRIKQECDVMQAEVGHKLSHLESVQKKGRDYKETAESYVLQEKKLFTAHFNRLVNLALHELIAKTDERVRQWINELEKMVEHLLLPELNNSVKTLATGVINDTNAQLSQWAKSENVSIGIPGHLNGPVDTTMGGFEQHLCDEVTATALKPSRASWQLSSESGQPELRFIYSDEATGETRINYLQGKAFADLEQIAEGPVQHVFNGWSLYRYICEYVCRNNKDEYELVALELTDKFKNLQSKVRVDEQSKKVITELYFTCLDPASDTKTSGASAFMEEFENAATKVSLDFKRIETTEAVDELGLVRLDSGLTTGGVGKLKDCMQKYERYIRSDSQVLPLVHAFPEEENMVVREREMFKATDVSDQRLLPSALSQIFANKQLLDLFLAMYYTGFVVEVPEDKGLSSHYWLYANYSKLTTLLKGSIEDMQTFTGDLEEMPAKHFGDLFDLNETVQDGQAGLISSRRKVTDKPDFFNAMVRFVQRIANGDMANASFKQFPFTMVQVAELLSLYKSLWARKFKDGKAIDLLLHDLEHWSSCAEQLKAISDEEWDGEVIVSEALDTFEKDLGVLISSSALTKSEAIEFLKQIAISLRHYYLAVKPTEVRKRRGL